MPTPEESGVNVYPRMQVPRGGAGGGGGRESDPSLKRPKRPKTALIVGAAAAVVGLGAGFAARPAVLPPARIGELEDQVAARDKQLKTAKSETEDLAKAKKEADDRADKIQHELDDALGAKSKLETKAADLDKKAKEIADVEAKLKVVIDKNGEVHAEGEEIHLQLVDKVLFKLNDDALTDKGKALIDQVAGALRDIPDKQIWVQGHTDDQPIFVPPPPRPAPPPKKGAKPAPAPPAPAVPFKSNWELSAARALTVVHYLQDVGKIDPTRLAALAFGQYRPVSRTNKALNRRIEIVLYPKRVNVEKVAPPAAPASGK